MPILIYNVVVYDILLMQLILIKRLTKDNSDNDNNAFLLQ